MIKNILSSFFILHIGLVAFAQSYNGPESVEFYKPTHHYFISNTSSHVIMERDGSGNLTTFASGIGSGPYGLEIINDTLYACSGGSIKAFQIPGGTLLYTVNLGATFLNGITHDNNGNIFTSDFSAKKIYRVSTVTHTGNVFVTGMTYSPNGMAFDTIDNKLIFVNWGNNVPVQSISLQDSSVSTLTTTTLDNCDGVAITTLGEIIISSWGQNACTLYDHGFTNSPITIVTGLHSPADLGYNSIGDTLAIPNSGNNTVVFFALHQPNLIQNNLLNNQMNFSQDNRDVTIENFPEGGSVYVYNSYGQLKFTGNGSHFILPLPNTITIVQVFDKNKNLISTKKFF